MHTQNSISNSQIFYTPSCASHAPNTIQSTYRPEHLKPKSLNEIKNDLEEIENTIGEIQNCSAILMQIHLTKLIYNLNSAIYQYTTITENPKSIFKLARDKNILFIIQLKHQLEILIHEKIKEIFNYHFNISPDYLKNAKQDLVRITLHDIKEFYDSIKQKKELTDQKIGALPSNIPPEDTDSIIALDSIHEKINHLFSKQKKMDKALQFTKDRKITTRLKNCDQTMKKFEFYSGGRNTKNTRRELNTPNIQHNTRPWNTQIA